MIPESSDIFLTVLRTNGAKRRDNGLDAFSFIICRLQQKTTNSVKYKIKWDSLIIYSERQVRAEVEVAVAI